MAFIKGKLVGILVRKFKIRWHRLQSDIDKQLLQSIPVLGSVIDLFFFRKSNPLAFAAFPASESSHATVSQSVLYPFSLSLIKMHDSVLCFSDSQVPHPGHFGPGPVPFGVCSFLGGVFGLGDGDLSPLGDGDFSPPFLSLLSRLCFDLNRSSSTFLSSTFLSSTFLSEEYDFLKRSSLKTGFVMICCTALRYPE